MPLVMRRARGARRCTWNRDSPLTRTPLVALMKVELMFVQTQRTSLVRIGIALVAEMMMLVVWFVPRIDTEKIVSSARWMMAIALVCTNVLEVQGRLVTLIILVRVTG